MNGTEQMKVLTLLNYIRQICAWKSRQVTDIREQEWMLSMEDVEPDGEYICVSAGKNEFGEEILMEVVGSEPVPCPPPPETLDGWILTPDWEDLRVEEVENFSKLSRNRQAIVRFHDSAQRVRDFADWRDARAAWRIGEKNKEKARKLFGNLYRICERCRRESGSVELVAGNGFFSGKPESGIHHPLLLKRVRMRYEAGRIQLLDTGDDIELYTEALRGQKGMDAGALLRLRDMIEKAGIHPLQEHLDEEFLRELASSLAEKCRYVGKDSGFLPSDDYILYECPVIFLRRKNSSLDKLAAAIMMRIGKEQEVTAPLLDLVGEEFRGRKETDSEDPQEDLRGEDVLITGDVQAGIVRAMEDSSILAVQTPPGTGKDAVMADLVGHFLAEGSRVLVVGSSRRALGKLKGMLPEGMGPLCASVLEDSDWDAGDSARRICEVLRSSTGEELAQEVRRLREKRQEVREELYALRQKLQGIWDMEREAGAFSYEGEEYSLSGMARFVHEHEDLLGMIPGEVSEGKPLPLSREELVLLYGSNGLFRHQDLKEMAEDLPKSSDVLSPERVRSLFREQSILRERERGLLQELPDWYVVDDQVFYRHEPIVLDFQEEAFLEAEEEYRQIDFMWLDSIWAREAVLAGRQGGSVRQAWDRMGEDVLQLREAKEAAVLPLLGKSVECPEGFLADDRILEDLSAMREAFEARGHLPMYLRLLHGRWRRILRQVLVDGHRIRSREECETALRYLQLQQARRKVRLEWDQLLGQCGEPSYEELSASEDDVDDICSARWEQIAFCLDWYEKHVASFRERLKQAGILLEKIMPEGNRFMTPRQCLAMDFRWMQDEWPQYAALLRLACIEKQMLLKKHRQHISELSKHESQLARRMAAALQGKSARAYRKEYDRLLWYESMMEKFRERKALLEKLAVDAPAWAEAIGCQQGISGLREVPAALKDAWKCRQFLQELEKATQEDAGAAEKSVRQRKAQFHELTARLTEKAAWQKLFEKVEENGGRERILEMGNDVESRGMLGLFDIVPAWVMPVDKAVETLRPGSRKFDVILMDDAGRMDVTLLLLLYFGNKAVVLGDDRQPGFCPFSFADKARQLRKTTLDGKFQHADLYDPDMSLFDVARRYYEEGMLRVQIQSVPEILGYSNRLCYGNRLQAFRESCTSALQPVVSYELEDGHGAGRPVNRKEAEAVVSFLAACMEQPEYEGKSFGVVSLAGDDQGDAIRELAMQRIGIQGMEKRKFLCGSPADFQGEMRDVVFLSLVDGEEGEKLLRMLDAGEKDATKKAYNVAASRAGEQLWIVHSMGLSSLRSGDIRRGLLEYSVTWGNPGNGAEAPEESSSFRKEAAEELRRRGYHVEERWPAGACRVEFAVISGRRRAAILCEGEEESRPDPKVQAILEDMGWMFLHLRGSEFYRSPGKAMDRLEEELRGRNILPLGEGDASIEEVRTELLDRVMEAAARIREAWKKSEKKEEEKEEKSS